MALRIKYDVIRFEVSENNIVLVECFDCANDLANLLFGFCFVETPLDLQILTQVASCAEFHYHKQALGSLESVVELDNKRVIGNGHPCHDFFLSEVVLKQLLLLGFLFTEHFHGHELSSGYFFNQEHFPK